MKRAFFLPTLALSCGCVLAADLPRKTQPLPPSAPFLSAQAVANWTGFYAGVLAGAGMGDAMQTSVAPITNADLSPIAGKVHRSGAVGGFQAGYGVMTGSIFMGVESDLALTTTRGKQNANGAYNGAPASASLEAKTPMMGTLRGRIGHVIDDVLIYGTGGMASALQTSTFTVTQNDRGASQTSSGSSRGLYVGWALGLGVEKFFVKDLSGKLEYLYVSVGDGIRARQDPNGLHLLRGGVNYHF